MGRSRPSILFDCVFHTMKLYEGDVTLQWLNGHWPMFLPVLPVFYSAVGWGVDQGVGGFGDDPGVKAQILHLIRSVRTVMRGWKVTYLHEMESKFTEGNNVDIFPLILNIGSINSSLISLKLIKSFDLKSILKLFFPSRSSFDNCELSLHRPAVGVWVTTGW